MCFRFIILFVLCGTQSVSGQKTFQDNDPFKTGYFIENRGQFNGFSSLKDSAAFGVENGCDRIFISPSAIRWIFTDAVPGKATLIQKITFSTEHLEEYEKEHAEQKVQEIGLQWLNTSPQAYFTADGRTAHYFTYGTSELNSRGYQKITCHQLYPGIDLEYILPASGGIKYSLIIHPGARPEQIAFAYTGAGVHATLQGDSITISNGDHALVEKGLHVTDARGRTVPLHYTSANGIFGFRTVNRDFRLPLTIDPWIINSGHLSGNSTGAKIACDVDYDYAGNIYIYGGSPFNGSYVKVAKYSASGSHLWTFGGYLANPPWNSNGNFTLIGNFVVEKTSGKVYMGQGFNSTTGSIILRLDSTGAYDQFMSKSDPKFNEIWEMNFTCDKGSILGMGGGTTSNINMGIIEQDGSYSAVNITGYSPAFQDILSSTIDPNGNLFVAMASASFNPLNNVLIHIKPDYTGNYWKAKTGFMAFSEADNKRYITHGAGNGFNALYANTNYLYYYDGMRIAAYNKTNGKMVGNYDSIKNYKARYQGGIYADDCDNIYIGGDSANILVYHFDGKGFKRIDNYILQNQSGRHITDIRYNPGTNHMYICGDSLLATMVPDESCDKKNIAIQLKAPDPCDAVLSVHVENADSNSSYLFIWKDSTTGIEIRRAHYSGVASDTLKNPVKGHVYHVMVIQNAFCGGGNTTVRYEFLSSYSDTVFYYNFCPGDSFYFRGDFYTTPAEIIDTIPRNGLCDSLVFHRIHWRPVSETHQNFTFCRGMTVVVGKHSYSASGWYTDTLEGYNSCDSVVHTGLVIQDDTAVSRLMSLCEGDTLFQNGRAYTKSGVYTDTFARRSGCDSLVTTELTVHPVFLEKRQLRVCDYSPVIIHGRYVFPPANVSDTFTSRFGCDSIIQTGITVSDISAAFDISDLQAPMFEFTDRSIGAMSYYWTFGDGAEDRVRPNPVHNYGNQKGTFRVCLTVTDSYGCKDSICKELLNKGIQFYLYNVFTPGSDQYNDVYKIGWEGFFTYDLMIYNRWGELVYQAENKECSDTTGLWNGLVMNSGAQCPEGSYFSIFRIYTGDSGTPYTQVTGVITLIR